MATELELFLRERPEPERVVFDADEKWEVKDTERLVLVLDGERVVRWFAPHGELLFGRVKLDGDGR